MREAKFLKVINLTDPAPEASWVLWYQDVFDRESPRQVEVRGRGLATGLAELWVRHLFETVGAEGQKGFSRFDLWWQETQKSIKVTGDWQGMVRLRTWIYGKTYTTHKEHLHEADIQLLQEIVRIHGSLVLAGQTSEPILALAANLDNRTIFEEKLIELL